MNKLNTVDLTKKLKIQRVTISLLVSQIVSPNQLRKKDLEDKNKSLINSHSFEWNGSSEYYLLHSN